ncbi:MAG: hypothetical protein IJG63_03425, partial [Oscillospiraceae bacterium]|nr:hypothetical protein [Oscillospiraceae bacterium]
ASEEDALPTPKAAGHEAKEQLARERAGDIAREAYEKRASAAARVSDQTLKNNIREKRRQIEDIENLIGGGEANPGQARKLETLRAELRAMETEQEKRTAAKPKKAKSQAKAEKPEAKPAPYADPIEDDGKGRGSAQEAVKAAEAAEKAERKKGKKKTAKPHRAAAETAKKLVGLFGVEKEDRARAEKLVMDALVKYARRGRMSTGEVCLSYCVGLMPRPYVCMIIISRFFFAA